MGLLTLFYTSFLIGLTGAMAPGPLLTVTIGESLRRGAVAGPLLALGHSLLEFFLLLLIVFGFTKWLSSEMAYGLIALSGGIVLIYMGFSIIKTVKTYTLTEEVGNPNRGVHPLLLGVMVTLSNPYWFIWWLTIGTGYVIFAKDIGISGITLFFIGHILSDFAWYSFVSYGIRFGGKLINVSVLRILLFLCSIFLLLFALMFIYKGFKLLL